MAKIKTAHKLFTRSSSLPSWEAYSEGVWMGVPELTDFCFSVFILYVKRGVGWVCRNLEESSENLCNSIISKIEKNKNFFFKFNKKYLQVIKSIRQLTEKISEKNYDFEDKKMIIKDIEHFSAKSFYAWGGMVMVYWIMVRANQDSAFKKEFSKVVMQAFKLREESEELFGLSTQFFQSILEYISKKERINIELIENLRLKELKDYFRTSKLPPISKLEERNKGYVILNNRFFALRGKSLDSFLAEKNCKIIEEKTKVNKGAKEIQGQVAFQGKIQGRIRILMHFREAKNFKQDEVLVVPMTSPTFLPAIKKAKAIITDEGGVLCHAAIVSREMKIPCIIGTKIATAVLRDGDLVEVDANKGVVKILKQKT